MDVNKIWIWDFFNFRAEIIKSLAFLHTKKEYLKYFF
jgi:hypothetical protein